MAGKNIKQVYDANPATTLQNTDLMYLGRNPYDTSDDFAILWSNILAATNAGADGRIALLNSANVVTHANSTLVLTNPLADLQVITLNNADTVKLPDLSAQTPPWNGRSIRFKNAGTLGSDSAFKIVAHDGSTIVYQQVEIGQTVDISVKDDTSVNGFVSNLIPNGYITRRIINGGNLGTDIPLWQFFNTVLETSLASNFTASLIGTNGIVSGVPWWFKNNSNGNLTFTPTSPNTIDGQPFLTLLPGEGAQGLCNGVQFETISLSQNEGTFLPLAGGTMLGNLILNADATQALQAVTYQQLTNAVAGLTPKADCKASTTTNLVGTYNNGSSGVGATFTVTATGVFATDGYTPVLNDRIYFLNQTAALQNGIYVATTVGALGVQPVFTRATDYNSSAQIVQGAYSFVQNGTTLGGTTWSLTTAGSVTVGTTALTYSQLGGILAGLGLLKPSPNTIAIDPAVVEQISHKGAASGYAPLDINSFLPAANFGATTITDKTAVTAGTFADVFPDSQAGVLKKATSAQLLNLILTNGVAPPDYSATGSIAAPFPRTFTTSNSVSAILTFDVFTGNVLFGEKIACINNGAGNVVLHNAAGVQIGQTITPGTVSVFYVSGIAADTLTPLFNINTMAAQGANNVNITGGSIDGVAIGLDTPAAATFSSLGFRNLLNTFTSFLTNACTASRTYLLQNRDGTLADDTDLATKQNTSGKDATGGYAGLTLFKINFKNALNTFTSFFTNSNTAARTYTFQDRDGTIADDTDLSGKQSTSGKDATGGYAGLTLFKINFKNALNTFTSFFTNANTAARTYTFQDRDGTIADNTDLAAKAPLTGAGTSGTWAINVSGNAATTSQISNSSTSLNFTGSFTLNSQTISYAIAGKMVTLSFPDLLATATSGGTFLSSTALPAALWPLQKMDQPMRITDNAGQPTAPGLVRVRTNGVIEIYKDLNGASFTNSAQCGLQGGPFTYESV